MKSFTKEINKAVKNMLKNKMVMYIVLSIVVINAMGYLMVNNITAIILLFLVGLLTSFFSKNMIVVMLVAVLFTNLLVGNKTASRTPLLEGLPNGDQIEEIEEKVNEAKNLVGENNAEARAKAIDAARDLLQTLPDDEEHDTFKSEMRIELKALEEQEEQEEEEQEEQEGFRKLRPAALNESADAAELDFPGSIESAYDNLDKLLSSDAINKMSNDTQNLAEKVDGQY